jgi:2-amino-4-hydroxy-6-hydroxymethyldihydropteridine diphosphokinase
MTEVYLGLGSNMGDREKNLSDAISLLSKEAGAILQCSSVWETAPWGFEAETSFLNMVISVQTGLEVDEFFRVMHSIESRLGRERSGRGYCSRTMDIDVLFWGVEIINREGIIIPHPAIAARLFVLKPLNEIAADFVHPVTKLPVSEMLGKCGDRSEVKLFRV